MDVSSFCCSVAHSCLTLSDPKDYSTPGLPLPHISWSWPKFMFVASVILSSHLILWCPLLLPSRFPSIRDFFNESSIHIRWPKYWSFSFSISPASAYSGFISLKLVWSPCCPREFHECSLASQFKDINSLVFCLLHGPALTSFHMTTGKTIALIIQTFVGRVMSLLFNTLSRFVIAFLSRNKHLLILWLQSPSAVILEPQWGKRWLLSRFPILFSI